MINEQQGRTKKLTYSTQVYTSNSLLLVTSSPHSKPCYSRMEQKQSNRCIRFQAFPLFVSPALEIFSNGKW